MPVCPRREKKLLHYSQKHKYPEYNEIRRVFIRDHDGNADKIIIFNKKMLMANLTSLAYLDLQLPVSPRSWPNFNKVNKMKGVILAGGKGARLEPLTEITNKHLLPVGREPMIWHPVRQLANAGITGILVITSAGHLGGVAGSLGSGSRFGCEFTYRVQEKAGGIAHALALAESYAGGERLVVLLGDNIFEYSLAPHTRAFMEQGEGARILLKRVDDPGRYGVAALKGGRVTGIEEKPGKPKSRYAVVGCYMYDHRVFELIRRVEPSLRGEMEITSVNNLYIKEGLMRHGFIRGRWTDAGTFESWHGANLIMYGDGSAPILSHRQTPEKAKKRGLHL